MKKHEFTFNGYNATVLVPDNFNGKWLWKTEFFYAFDKAEQTLLNMGYARVYYQISNMYGSDRAVRLMHKFHLHLTEKFGFTARPCLFGFSRGGLYAFNYALYYPEYVDKNYLDAPVLNLKSWPPKDSAEHLQLLSEYLLDENTFQMYNFSPIDRLPEFSRSGHKILLVAGLKDSTVPYNENGKILADYYAENGLPITVITKPDCDHHPHSLENVEPIIKFIEK